jgi:phospholipid-binding lipoprotein MlaA
MKTLTRPLTVPVIALAMVGASVFLSFAPPAAAAETSENRLAASQGPLLAAARNDSLRPRDNLGDVTVDEEEQTTAPTIADPLEPWNRAWYHFNDKLYFWLLRPAAEGYKYAVPEDFRFLFANAYDNAKAPVTVLNNLFQLKFRGFLTELLRFVINTTMGVGGLRDCAKDCFGIARYNEDFGQTLGHYGVGHGFYLVWPFFGPSSARDSLGLGADMLLSPTSPIGPLDPDLLVSAGLTAHRTVNTTSLHLGDYEAIKAAAVDPYVAIKDGYLQYRKREVEK